MEQHHVSLDDFPEFLQGASRIVAMLGQDGVVVIHWRAEEDSFEFRHLPNKNVAEILSEQEVGELKYQDDGSLSAFKLQGPHWIMDTGDLRPITEIKWKTVEVTPDVDADTWSEERARIQAHTDVSEFAEAHLLGIDVSSAPPEDRSTRIISEIEKTIGEFEQLLASSPSEQRIKEYLTTARSRVLLHHFATEVIVNKALDQDNIVDLVIDRSDGVLTLVKIGLPTHPVLTTEGTGTNHKDEAQHQVEKWLDWLSQHKAEANIFIQDATEVEGWIVLGRQDSFPLEYRHETEPIWRDTGNVRVKTYDDLLDSARQYVVERRALVALNAGPGERLVEQLFQLVPQNTWFGSSSLSRVLVQVFRVYRVPFGNMRVLPSTPLVMDFDSIEVRAVLGRDIILYPDPESFHLFPSANGSLEQGTQEVWIITSEGEFLRTTNREMWRSTKDGVIMMLMTPSQSMGDIGEVPGEVLPEVREKLVLARSAIIATLGQNAAFERLFEVELRAGPDISQFGAITPKRISPITYDFPRLDGNSVARAQLIVKKVQLLDDDINSRVRLALRWYLQAQKQQSEQEESAADVFVSYWVAIEALAMPNTTNIMPVKKALADIHSISVQEVNDVFPIGRISNLRGKILHEGHVPEIRWELLVFMDNLFKDVLLSILDVPASPSTSVYLDGSAKNYLPT